MALKSGGVATVKQVFQTIVYLGKPTDRARETNQGARVVKDLVSPWYKPGRNVTLDNFFTSILLVVEWLHHNMTLVGTLRSNKADIPPEIKKES